MLRTNKGKGDRDKGKKNKETHALIYAFRMAHMGLKWGEDRKGAIANWQEEKQSGSDFVAVCCLPFFLC